MGSKSELRSRDDMVDFLCIEVSKQVPDGVAQMALKFAKAG
jgi:hypothetical protein